MSVPRYWRKQQNRYNLKGNKCETCGRYFFPPRAICPECRRDGKIVDYEFSGNGTVRTFSVIRTASDDYDIQTPYAIAIIELEEGTCMTAQVICDPDEIAIGMPVKSVFRKIISEGDSGVIVYGTKFVPA
ncbi:Zn-ribbon domain-containing OB-fold protein [Methanogenium cariaci]|jgi:scaffold protein (connect acetoacetyl-CoA thiolase and HMG-CoA synthase)|uniref:Zn-ribbon domain-containing OB-fold protein n=1 Tax=Methanogenium cariaci TaxID=2197 RepID=UPI000785F46E|nr:Zn-ribbon domain-containing OB-fold protein [Methanogenium cariaci]